MAPKGKQYGAKISKCFQIYKQILCCKWRQKPNPTTIIGWRLTFVSLPIVICQWSKS